MFLNGCDISRLIYLRTPTTNQEEKKSSETSAAFNIQVLARIISRNQYSPHRDVSHIKEPELQ